MDHQGCTSSVKHKRSDFSIARILGTIDRRPETPESPPASPEECVSLEVGNQEQEHQRFEWLQCTRYRPPRLPRSRRREGAQRRKLGRNPRIPFSSAQVGVLEQRFRRSQYLSSTDVAELAAFLALSETRVKIWFQNRRARERRDRDTRQRSPDSSPPSEPSSSLAGIARSHGLSLPEVRQRSLAEAAVALAGISRVHGLNELAVSRAHALAGTSAFAPVTPLALLAATSARSGLALIKTAIRSGSPGG